MSRFLGEGFPSGQRDQTVNLTRKLRWFESTPLHHYFLLFVKVSFMGGCSSVVEPQPSKLMMRVRFPLPAPLKGSSFAHIAQSVEHFLGKEEVTGSNPVMSSINFLVARAYGGLLPFVVFKRKKSF